MTRRSAESGDGSPDDEGQALICATSALPDLPQAIPLRITAFVLEQHLEEGGVLERKCGGERLGGPVRERAD